MASTETPTPVLSLPQAVSSAGGGQGGFLMGESRAALGAALEGFQKEPEATLPEKPSELPRLFLEQLFLWGEKGWGRGSLQTTPLGDEMIFAGCTGSIQSGPPRAGECQGDSQGRGVAPGDENPWGYFSSWG